MLPKVLQIYYPPRLLRCAITRRREESRSSFSLFSKLTVPGCQVNKRGVLGGVLLQPALDWFPKPLTFQTSGALSCLCSRSRTLLPVFWADCPQKMYLQMPMLLLISKGETAVTSLLEETFATCCQQNHISFFSPHRWVIHWGCQQLVASGQPR